MLHEPARHELLSEISWDEERARSAIRQIVEETEASFSAEHDWPMHPLDADDGDTQPNYSLYFGACGVIWALHYLESIGAVTLRRRYGDTVKGLLARNRRWLTSFGSSEFSSYLMGDPGILLLDYGLNPSKTTEDLLCAAIESNLENPTRELLWGSPGTLLAALFMFEATGSDRFADLFRLTARKLWSQLIWSPEFECHYWTQDMYGRQSSYLGGGHGFAATAGIVIRGRGLLPEKEWELWEQCIVTTVSRTAIREPGGVNWAPVLLAPEDRPVRLLMQYCHGAPGFVICLNDLPTAALDAILVGAGQAIWQAGPLVKGAGLCHGTGGNGLALLKLYRRTRDALWLDRARAFAMHGLAQCESDRSRYGQSRFSLWTGDLGFAIFLWECIQGVALFPSLDVFFRA